MINYCCLVTHVVRLPGQFLRNEPHLNKLLTASNNDGTYTFFLMIVLNNPPPPPHSLSTDFSASMSALVGSAKSKV